jgi:hypothetical protein
MNIFEHFSCHTTLPIRLDDIRAHILEMGIVRSIKFTATDLNESVCLGFLRIYRWRAQYSDEQLHAEIFYSKTLSESMMRVVLCKELIHILDNHTETAQTSEKVDTLIREIRAPVSIAASIPGLSDHYGLTKALCILLPRDALEIIRAHFQSGAMNIDAVAKLASIPDFWVEFLMSDSWLSVVNSIE